MNSHITVPSIWLGYMLRPIFILRKNLLWLFVGGKTCCGYAQNILISDSLRRLSLGLAQCNSTKACSHEEEIAIKCFPTNTTSLLVWLDLGNKPQVYGMQSGLSSHFAIAPVAKYSQLPCLALSKIGMVWKSSPQACLFYFWARHLAGCLDLYVADRWWGQAVYRCGGPSLTEDSQIEPER